jgi:hypothetical protein
VVGGGRAEIALRLDQTGLLADESDVNELENQQLRALDALADAADAAAAAEQSGGPAPDVLLGVTHDGWLAAVLAWLLVVLHLCGMLACHFCAL